MKALESLAAADAAAAVASARDARAGGRSSAYAGGGSDLLGMIKDRLVEPDVVIRLAAIPGLDRIQDGGEGVRIGGQATLDALARHPVIRERYAVLAEAARSVATPQIRNVATLAGNLCQRPWCWYFRRGFPCFKNGGSRCFAVTGENEHHAIFGGGPSYIVHPSDTAPALVALEARFRLLGPAGERVLPAADFFTPPAQDPARENALLPDELLAEVLLPPPAPGRRSRYHKVLDREAWTHAVVSLALVLDMDGELCRSARLVLGGVAPVPWRLPRVERLLAGQPLAAELAARAAALAVQGASPLAGNGYKVALAKAVVRRTLLELAGRG